MNVYDNANELAKAMRESHEYKKLKEAAVVLEKDPDAKKMVNEYLMVAQEVEFAKHQGKTPDQASVDKMQKLQGILNLNACIAVPEQDDEYLTSNSESFHKHLGYRMVGKFHNCGYKFGRWYHMIWMEKMIGGHGEQPEEIIPFPALKK